MLDQSLAYLFLSLVLATLCADFITGCVHWLADTYGHEDWPVIGPTLIYHFRNHHINPDSIVHHDFAETNFSALFFSALISLNATWIGSKLGFFVTCLCLFTGITNQVHKWAHDSTPPKVYRLLTKLSLGLNSKRHMIHHCGDHDHAYCITVGWLNPFLDKIQFFRFFEWILYNLLKCKPRHYTLEK